MEELIYVGLFILAVYVAIWLIVNVIAPISGVLVAVALIIGVGYAFITSIVSFIKSLTKHISPYTTYIDKNKDIPSGVRRSYFFGPGYHQIGITAKDAFQGQKDRVYDLSVWMGGVKTKLRGKWYFLVWVWIFYIMAYICTFLFGFMWMTVFSAILAIVMFVGMCVFYVFFSVLWIVDRVILMIKSIQSRCSNCKRISIVPAFVCPDCGTEHRKLTPGPYGIFTRRCTCGRKLATTIFNGRSRLSASCPYCGVGLAASDARQFGIQLVGGVSAGKTTFLAAFWHMYIARLNTFPHIAYEEFPPDAFDELEDWYRHGLSSSTTETNANMYSIVHTMAGQTPYQLTVYDIAGEAFMELSSNIQQQQFRYCEGIVIVIDPTASPHAASETISSFLNEFSGLKGKRSGRTSDIPVAVVISKADHFKRQIGLPKIKSRYNLNPCEFQGTGSEGQGTLAMTRNGVCREFLVIHGFENVMNLIDSAFENTQIFPVSAMGHAAVRGQPYEPWGVMEPVMWILENKDLSFSETIAIFQEVAL